eukprot:5469679-Pyramimonas_sp.AAC.1
MRDRQAQARGGPGSWGSESSDEPVNSHAISTGTNSAVSEENDSCRFDQGRPYDRPSPITTVSIGLRPVFSKPVFGKPVFIRLVLSKPVFSKPVFSKPVFSRLVFSKPVFSKPVFCKPVFSKPVFSKPVFSKPVFSKPVFGKPVLNRLVLSKPVFSRLMTWSCAGELGVGLCAREHFGHAPRHPTGN